MTAENKNELSNNVNVLPDFLVGFEGETGTEELKQYERLPFLRVVQGIGDLIEAGFNAGDIVLMPAKELYFPAGESFHVTPLFFFREWGLWYDIRAKVANPVKERSTDPHSEIAKRAMSREASERIIPDPDHKDAEGVPLPMEYRESLIYICYIHEKNEVVAISFNKGNHRTGRNFGELISKRSRAGAAVPIYAGVYKFTVETLKSRDQQWKWKGFSIDNAGWITQEQFALFKEHHERFKEIKESIIVDAQDDAPTTVVTDPQDDQRF